MAKSRKSNKLPRQLEKFSQLEKSTYIIYGSDDALTLYEQSLETLLESDCFDFDIREYSKQKYTPDLLEDGFELDGYRIINEKTFRKLHINICEKTQVQIVNPNRQKWLKMVEQMKAKDKNNGSK